MPLTRRASFWGLVGLGGLLVLYIVMAALGWPGGPDSCTQRGGNCYCEAFALPPDSVFINQIANTLSGVISIIVGLVILWIGDRERAARASGPNPMTVGGFFAITYGALALFLGPGSMFFHGSLSHFGGWFDNLSMILYVSFLVQYDIFRMARADDRVGLFAGIYAAINVALGILTWFVDGSGTIIFGILAGLAVVSQVLILIFHVGGVDRRFWPWLAAALGSFGVAIVIWRLSWTGAPLCAPDSMLQGHAVWHLLAMAVTPFCVFFYLRTESRAATATVAPIV
jgi:hypothetical protein